MRGQVGMLSLVMLHCTKCCAGMPSGSSRVCYLHGAHFHNDSLVHLPSLFWPVTQLNPWSRLSIRTTRGTLLWSCLRKMSSKERKHLFGEMLEQIV